MRRAYWLAQALFAGMAAAQQHAVTIEPRACAVGEPLHVICEVGHGAGGGARALEPELDPAGPWVFLDAAREPRGAEATRLTWRFLALDPERATPPELAYALRADADAEPRVVAVTAPAVELAGELAADEDAPRPLLGLRELPAEAAAAAPSPVVRLGLTGAALLAAALLAAGLLVRRRRARARSARPDATGATARLAALLRSEAPPRVRHYELTRIVRRTLDERAGVDRRGWTDAELAAALERDPDLRAKLGDAACDAAADVLRRAAEAKYAGVRPSDFALRETFERAERALAAVEARP